MSKKILIVEDEKAIARALELKLKSTGIEVEVAGNGEKGLEALEKEKFDLILLDLVMPKLDGFGFLEQMKAKKIKTPVIVLSNLSQEGDEGKAKEMGAKEFFIKSNTPLVDIVKHVNKILKV